MQKVTDNLFVLIIFAMAGTFLLAASFVYFFVRYQRKMLSQKEDMQKAELAHRENLLLAAIQSQEEERKRIGRDLHDDVGAALSNLRMVMGQIVSVNEATANTEAGTKYKPLIDNIINNVRTISHSLSPPGLDLFGLEYTLQELCDNFNGAGVLNLSMENNVGSDLDNIDPAKSLAIFRVIQEMLTNTLKHAAATKVVMSFDYPATNTAGSKVLQITYKDDGKGMDQQLINKPGMGMQNIESRLRIIGASFEIKTAPGEGFGIIIKLPV